MDSHDVLRIVSGPDALTAVTSIVSEVGSWVRVINEEATKQELLRAEASARVEAIRQEGALLLGYLDRSFDERKVLFARLLDALHLSLEAGATDEVASIAGAIISLAVKSPFADLKDVATIRSKLADRDNVIEI